MGNQLEEVSHFMRNHPQAATHFEARKIKTIPLDPWFSEHRASYDSKLWNNSHNLIRDALAQGPHRLDCAGVTRRGRSRARHGQ
jgi:hypothetical protein